MKKRVLAFLLAALCMVCFAVPVWAVGTSPLLVQADPIEPTTQPYVAPEPTFAEMVSDVLESLRQIWMRNGLAIVVVLVLLCIVIAIVISEKEQEKKRQAEADRKPKKKHEK